MADYHTTYTAPGETTEWEVLQQKYGNRPAPEPVWRPPAYTPAEEGGASRREGLNDDEDEEDGDDGFVQEYRRKRLAELAAARRPRFGSVEPLTASEFVQKVTNAGEGLWVVVHLYKDSVPACGLLAACLDALAPKYPGSKFLKIVSTDCIPNYPDQHLPTVLIYHNGAVVKTIVGLGPFGGHRSSPETVTLALNAFGPVCDNEATAPSTEEGGASTDATSTHDKVEAAAERLRRSLVDRILAQKEGGTDD